MLSDVETKAALEGIVNKLCKSRKRHDDILTRCVRDAVQNPVSTNPIADFASYLSRRLMKNEAVAVNMITLTAVFARDKHAIVPENGLELLQHYLKRQPPNRVLESQPVLNQKTHRPLLLIISHHAFRVLEITHDIWKVLNPDAPAEHKDRNEYLSNISHISENLTHMGMGYGTSDIIDCLNLITDTGAFYLRAGFLFAANIEPTPFVETLEGKGFHVAILIDDVETDEEFKEHDMLKRLQGYLIAKNEAAMAHAMEHIDFLQGLTQSIPLPKTDLASPLNMG